MIREKVKMAALGGIKKAGPEVPCRFHPDHIIKTILAT
jgi:hypothetical protein